MPSQPHLFAYNSARTSIYRCGVLVYRLKETRNNQIQFFPTCTDKEYAEQ